MAKSDSDYKEHEKTYEQFIKFTKYSVIALTVLMVFLYLVINP